MLGKFLWITKNVFISKSPWSHYEVIFIRHLGEPSILCVISKYTR